MFLEDLNLVGLSRAMLGKHCLDAEFGQFFNIAFRAKDEVRLGIGLRGHRA